MTIQMQSETAQSAANGNTEFISFAIGNDQYGVDIMAVREIKEWSNVTHLPKQPDYVRGVLNLRGVIVPIIDLRCRFGQGVTETSPMHVFIIVQIGDNLVGLLADRVSDIVSADPGDIKPVPNVSRSAGELLRDFEQERGETLRFLLRLPIETLDFWHRIFSISPIILTPPL